MYLLALHDRSQAMAGDDNIAPVWGYCSHRAVLEKSLNRLRFGITAAGLMVVAAMARNAIATLQTIKSSVSLSPPPGCFQALFMAKRG